MNAGLTHREMRMLRDFKAKANDEQLEAVVADWQNESYGRQAKHDKSLSQWMDAQEIVAAQQEAMQ